LVYSLNSEFPLINILKRHLSWSSVVLSINNEIVFSHLPLIKRPLASIIKIPVALEYSQQLSKGLLSANETHSLDEIHKYYIPKSDNGAHINWINSINGDSKEITLTDLVNGMMKFSSNANFEFLLKRLKIENINNHLSDWFSDHEQIFPITSAINILNTHKGLLLDNKYNDHIIRKSFIKMATAHFKRIDQVSQLSIPDITLQNKWSDLFPRASAQSYHTLIRKVNQQLLKDKNLNRLILETFGWILTHPRYNGFIHAGEKTGYTSKVFNKVLFAKNSNGHTLEFVYFIDNLTPSEVKSLHETDSSFTDKFMYSSKYRDQFMNHLQVIK